MVKRSTLNQIGAIMGRRQSPNRNIANLKTFSIGANLDLMYKQHKKDKKNAK